jgi:hypothetical protein
MDWLAQTVMACSGSEHQDGIKVEKVDACPTQPQCEPLFAIIAFLQQLDNGVWCD